MQGIVVDYRYRSADPAISPRVYRPTIPPPCFQRPWRSISWVGAPFWAMRRAMPTLPLWPLKNSQSARPAALAITFTRRAI